MNRHFILFALAFAAALSGFAKTFDVDISTGRPAASNEAYYHGETIEFRAVRGRTVVTNIEYASIYYQTNGMGDVWWKTDGLVFHPTNDIGAASYRFFMEGREANSSRDWHANGLLRLLPSPGFEPNTLEHPVLTLDFSGIEVLNAPWGDYAAVSNAAMSAAAANALQDAALESLNDSVATLSDSVPSATNALAQALADGSIPVRAETARFADSSDYAYMADYVNRANEAETANGLNGTEGERTADEIFEALDAATQTNALQDAAISSLNDTTSTLGDSISTLSDEAAPAINGYARLYSFVTGSTNANFVVTNYQLTAEAEAERTHYDPSDPDLDFSTVPPSLRLEDSSTGTNRVVVDTRDWTVWYFAQKIGGAMAEAVSTAIDTCRAWCGFTATGLENPVPDTLVVDVQNIWLMAGKTFEKHVAGSNAVWIICSSGVVMPISDNAQSAGGFLELTDAFGTPYIRFNKTESYFIDPVADGVEYDPANGAWLIAYSTVNCPKGGANAVLEGSTMYPGKAILKDEDDPDCPATITWTGSANNWVMHAVPKQIDGAVPPKMFFAAVVEVQGQDYIEYLRPMSIPHLLVDGVKIAPEIPASHPAGTTVSWKVVQ